MIPHGLHLGRIPSIISCFAPIILFFSDRDSFAFCGV